MKKIIIGSLLVVVLAPLYIAFAQDATVTTSSVVENPATVAVANETEIKAIKEDINTLRLEYQRLKEAVLAGTMTKAAAQAEWKKLLEQTRAKKKEVFQKRVEKMDERYSKLKEVRPEIAAVVAGKVEELKARRAETEAKRLEIKAKVDAGTITREQALQLKKEIVTETKERAMEAKKDFEVKREEAKSAFKEGLEQKKEELKDNRAKQEEILREEKGIFMKKEVRPAVREIKAETKMEIKNVIDSAKLKIGTEVRTETKIPQVPPAATAPTQSF